MACNLDQVQNVVDFRRESDGGTGKQFIEKDFYRVEPVERLCGWAVGYSFVVVAFAEVPEADLVEVVKTKGARERVDELDVAGGGGDDVGEVEFEEVGAADYGFGVYVADFDLRGFVRGE
jgi:hypothetical protein